MRFISCVVIIGFLTLTGCLAGSQGTVRPFSAKQSSLEERIGQGNDRFWILERRSRSTRWQTYLDGVLIVSAKSKLRLKPIRRLDGNHSLLLGKTGKPPRPIWELDRRLAEIKNTPFVAYPIRHIDTQSQVAILYAPQGAHLKVSLLGRDVVIDLDLPWEKTDPFDVSDTQFMLSGR